MPEMRGDNLTTKYHVVNLGLSDVRPTQAG